MQKLKIKSIPIAVKFRLYTLRVNDNYFKKKKKKFNSMNLTIKRN